MKLVSQWQVISSERVNATGYWEQGPIATFHSAHRTYVDDPSCVCVRMTELTIQRIINGRRSTWATYLFVLRQDKCGGGQDCRPVIPQSPEWVPLANKPQIIPSVLISILSVVSLLVLGVSFFFFFIWRLRQYFNPCLHWHMCLVIWYFSSVSLYLLLLLDSSFSLVKSFPVIFLMSLFSGV